MHFCGNRSPFDAGGSNPDKAGRKSDNSAFRNSSGGHKTSCTRLSNKAYQAFLTRFLRTDRVL
jgi:hypothetical protein